MRKKHPFRAVGYNKGYMCVRNVKSMVRVRVKVRVRVRGLNTK